MEQLRMPRPFEVRYMTATKRFSGFIENMTLHPLVDSRQRRHTASGVILDEPRSTVPAWQRWQ